MGGSRAEMEVHHILRQSKVRRWNLPDRKQRNDTRAEIYRKLVSYPYALRARHTVKEYKSRIPREYRILSYPYQFITRS